MLTPGFTNKEDVLLIEKGNCWLHSYLVASLGLEPTPLVPNAAQIHKIRAGIQSILRIVVEYYLENIFHF